MLKVLTAEQMREADRLTTERYGIPSIILMENAAHAVARVVTEKLGGSVKGKRILIVCGQGNNGGDGAALARILWNAGATSHVVLVGQLDKTKGDARLNFEILRDLAGDQFYVFGMAALYFKEITTASEYHEACGWLKEDLVVDALFGTGLSRPIEDEQLINIIRNLSHLMPGGRQAPIVSIDMPAGLLAEDIEWAANPYSIKSSRPDVTVTFTALKAMQVIPPGVNMCGEVKMVSIGSPDELLSEQVSKLFVSEPLDATLWLGKTGFSTSSYKNKRGHALIIAGSKNYTGAAVLCGDAGIRSGVGLVTIATPESSRDSIVARVSPEVMVRGISETADGSAAEKAVDEVKEFLKNVDVVAVGSGLSSKEDETKTFVRRIVEERTTPVVIDADGLTALSPWTLDVGSVENHPVGEAPIPLLRKEGSLELILTPHEGEFKKLLGVEGDEAKEILKDRVGAVRDFATKHSVFLVLKGERNLIGSPDGRVVVNPTGNPGLGKAGNGDTLTGTIAGFVAQAVQMKIDMLETLVAAVYVAGMAGDIAEKKFGKRVMTASDVRECLVDVFEELAK